MIVTDCAAGEHASAEECDSQPWCPVDDPECYGNRCSDHNGCEPATTNGRHELVEMMASNWDQLGRRPPWNWRWICACGEQQRSLPDQVRAADSWAQHLNATDSGGR